MVKHHAWKLIIAVALAVTLVAPDVSATSTVFQSIPPTPPPNDYFANATIISGLPFNDSVDMTYATTEYNEPQPCYWTQQKTVWYSYTPTASQVVRVTLSGPYDIGSVIYQAYGSEITNLSEINCSSFNSPLSLTFNANVGTTYYFQVGSIYGYGGLVQVTVEPVLPPANDNFINAEQIGSLPFSTYVDTIAATMETNEPRPSCESGIGQGTVWYSYTPTTAASLMVGTDTQNPTAIAIYTGTSLDNLAQQHCFYFMYGGRSSFTPSPGATYYFQEMGYGRVSFVLDFTPPPTAFFYYNPNDPTVFDNVSFWNNSYDPVGMGIQSQTWNFGDGSTSTEWSPTHRYAADGNYTVRLTVTTTDGRTASTTTTIPVKTRDVAITKFTVPQSASSGQTRQIVVGLNSKRYVEDVEVQLYKSQVGGGWQLIGTLRQTVPIRPSNRTTDFLFSYTFTKDDAAIGKVTFHAVALIVNARDALPADNEAIAPPTRVAK